MGSVGGWLSAAVTLCVFVIFHKLSGHEAKPSERTREFPCTEGRAAGPERDGQEGKASRVRWSCHVTGSNRVVEDGIAIRPRARLQSDT